MYLLIYKSNLNLPDKRCKTQLLKNEWVTISKKRKKKKRKIGTNGIHKFKVSFFLSMNLLKQHKTCLTMHHSSLEIFQRII